MNQQDAETTARMADAIREAERAAERPENQIAFLRGQVNQLEFTKCELITLLLDTVGIVGRICDVLATELDERDKR